MLIDLVLWYLRALERFDLTRFVGLHIGGEAKERQRTRQGDQVSNRTMVTMNVEHLHQAPLRAVAVVALDSQVPYIDTACCVTCDELQVVNGQIHRSDALPVSECPFAAVHDTALLTLDDCGGAL